MALNYIKKYPFLLFFISSILIFLAHTAYTKTAIFADARYYYSYTHSAVKDFDLNFTNEYKDLNAGGFPNSVGYPTNFYPPGVSLFWIPGFFTADMFAKSINIFIPNLISTKGYGFFYQFFAGATSTFLGVLGLFLVYQLLKDYFSNIIALISTSALFFTTNLFFYTAVEPINSHAVSFFISSLFVFYFLKNEKDKHYYVTLGLIGGVAGLIRTQDLLILILPVIKIFLEKTKLSTLITYFLQLSSGALITFLPQILLWNFFFNTFWYSPYLDSGFNFFKPQFIHVLFNTQNGLFMLTPSILTAVIGLLTFRKRKNSIFLYSITYFLLQLYLISSWSVYTQGGSYSIRMIITTYPLLIFGLASVVKYLFRKSKLITYSLLSIFVFYNFISIIHYLLGY